MPCLDSLARPINYLRLSVTDRCNLRCVYCMPPEGIQDKLNHEAILSYEEFGRVVHAAADLGICRVRLTGGEPLARAGLSHLVRIIAGIEEIDDLAMTTNGVLLARHARELREAGLQRVNISLDTLRAERFSRITRLGKIEDVLAGIRVAEEVGLRPVKINMVVMRGFNDDEVIDFARQTIATEWHVRFIEVMPVGQAAGLAVMEHVPIAEVRRAIEFHLGPLLPEESRNQGNGPARYFRLPHARGTIGFIAALSEHFCFQCNRLRLTADGRLRACLMSDDEVDLREALRGGASQEALQSLILQAIASKPAGHQLSAGLVPAGRSMSQIGG